MTPFSMQLKRDREGRIVEKTETVAGKTAVWAFAYDKAGRLTRATLNGRTVCDIGYDREGRRARDYFPHLDTSYRTFEYRTDDRLYRAGNNSYIHDENGFRSIWNHGGQYTLYEYGPDYRLLKVEWPEKSELAFTHDDQGRRAAKYRDGRLVEAYAWHDLIRLAGFFDGQREYEFAYRDEERTPCTMRRDDGAVFALHFDQAGSLRVVADEDGNVIKEVQYDPFGSVLADTNPALRIPLGFAGGLHDRDLGFVRFGWRDYDTFTSRWTAPDPIGDAGGDPDWYGYCLDDPVNGNDPLGLFWDWAVKQGVRQATKAGIKKAGKTAAEKNPGNGFLEGVDRFLNGKGLTKDPMATDSDNDGISDYYDYDSDWDVSPDKLAREREQYHREKDR